MKPNHTRRGKTQTVKNAAHKNCHSRGISGPQGSAVFRIRIYNREKQPLFHKQLGQKGDPRLWPSGMTALFDNSLTARGFTLIELLVGVLIIGILAAVALPQYQKAVEKSRMTEMALFIKNAQQAVDVWLLQNGGFPDTNTVLLDATNNLLDIDLAGMLNTERTHSKTGYFVYWQTICYPTYCSFMIWATDIGGFPGPDVSVLKDADGWRVTCDTSPTDDEGKEWCKRFKTVYPDVQI